MAASERLDILDESDQVIGSRERSEVHARGLAHRAVHILVRDRAGRLLLQLRSLHKDTAPGLWDTSVGGHVQAGDAPLASALREAREELGIALTVSDLSPLPSHRVDLPHDRERVSNWEAIHEGPFHPDPAEVADIRWFDAAQIRDLVASRACTPHFRLQWDAWLEAHMDRAPGAP